MTRKLTYYEGGNWLRGFFGGKFKNDDEAWSYISHRFLMSYPSEHGRHIYMKRQEVIYGIEQLVAIKEDITEINTLNDQQVARKVKRK
jgi:hypothetical protein